MKLIVGLGNPGPKYETTRHNAGFLVLDLFAEEARSTFESSKFKGDLAKATICGETCLLLKPMTFMNLSGQSVVPVMHYYKIGVEDLVVMHDEIDIASGTVKARTSGGPGGHNGIRSIIKELGTQDFHRIKLGVGRPPPDSKQEVSNWVLGRMTDEELLGLQKEVFDGAKLRLSEIFKRK